MNMTKHQDRIKKMLSEKTSPGHFAGFKRGSQLAFQIEPICFEVEVPDPDRPGKTKHVRECIEHVHEPEALAEAFDEIRTLLGKFGFQIQIFGSPASMYKSLKKRFGNHMEETESKQYSTYLLINFTNSILKQNGIDETVSMTDFDAYINRSKSSVNNRK